MIITVLGCGTSSGVPMIGCDCSVCKSNDPRNRRRRVSALVEDDNTCILIDTPPDLREQLLDAGVSRLDGVCYTHGHADHVHGLDDLRSINYHMQQTLPAYGTAATLSHIRERFSYAFGKPSAWWTRPGIEPREVDGPFKIGEIDITPFDQSHGRSTTTGFRFGQSFAYSTDVKVLSDAAIEALQGVRVWVVDCLGYREHPTHSHLENTLRWVERVKPGLAVLTHMSHQFDYETLAAELPKGVVPGIDGMTIDTDHFD